MQQKMESFSLDGTACQALIPGGTGPWPAAYLCGGQMAGQLASLAAFELPVLLLSADAVWEKDYTPWPAPALPDGAPFAGGAKEHLAFLTERMKPYAENHYPICPGREHSALLGYSLGGLFSLWAFCETAAFGLYGSLSGSLWYEGWLSHLAQQQPSAARVYLSLGKTEDRAKNPRMQRVSGCTQQTAALLTQALGKENVLFQWNRGGHFTGIPGRWKKALCALFDLPETG